MKKMLMLLCGTVLLCCAVGAVKSTDNDKISQKAAEKLLGEGNYRDAYQMFQKLLFDKKYADVKPDYAACLAKGVLCLRSLNQLEKFDGFIEEAVKTYSTDWRLLAAAGEEYTGIPHYGFRIAGKFERGEHRGGGVAVMSFERDRTRALQLFVQAMPLLQKDAKADNNARREFFHDFAAAIGLGRTDSESWRLQYLTDLDTLPDYREGYIWSRRWNSASRGAPVTADGKPVFYYMPEDFKQSANDGERWRWALAQAEKYGDNSVQYVWADFLWHQFGVQTMAFYRTALDKLTEGPFAVHLLPEDETIAKMATGIQRFKLDPQFNYIKIFEKVGNSKVSDAENALNRLAEIFSNRRQYERSAGFWRESIKRFGPGSNNWKQDRLDQIVKNWGVFDSVNKFPAGTNPKVYFKYRNGGKVALELYRLKRDKYVDDIKSYLKDNPKQVDGNRISINQIGYMIVKQNEKQYIDELEKKWDYQLKPLPDHFDRTESIEIPASVAGVYLLKAMMADGNTSSIVIWVTDTAIASRDAGDRRMFYAADAVTGEPVAETEVEFFGYRIEYLDRKWWNTRRFNVLTDSFKMKTDARGIVVVNRSKFKERYTYFSTINGNNRFAVTGFEGYWYPRGWQANYSVRKIYGISDRPVYRPGQTVQFKYWIRQASYGRDEKEGRYADTNVTVELWSPRGQKVMSKEFRTDSYGGLNGEYKLPDDAELGSYNLRIKNWGGYFNFRVEEYKKPEFEVKINAPDKPIKLGDKFTATIEAKYYFGAPVTKAKVKYKIQRYDNNLVWYPMAYWDWFYEPGYWWFAYDYTWYPNWSQWGWCRPHWLWMGHRSYGPPELVGENEVDIGPDGIVKVNIDSAAAKALFGDRDSRYEITAEVVDASRRTIVGKGNVIAAAKPFKVCCWTQRGFYRPGDNIDFKAKVITADKKGVAGKGELTLFLISYDKDGNPKERALRQWKLDTDAEGKVDMRFTVPDAGQYRLAYALTDAAGDSETGGCIFPVVGDKAKVDDFRFDAIELINDKKEYAPDEEVNLMINVARPDSLVLLFVRAGEKNVVEPEFIRIQGRSAMKKIKIAKADMPNFFVEAWTINNGKIFSTVRQIVVPPEKRVLNVAVNPSSTKYKPGEKAKVKLKITDYFGKPVVGEVVVTVYDKAVEYISGGSNVPPIKPFFWKWLRHYYSSMRFSMNLGFYNIADGQTLNPIGIFGYLQAPASGATANLAFDGAAGAMPLAAAVRKGGVKKEMVAKKAVVAESMMADSVDADTGAGGGAEEVTVRTKFADTAFWAAKLETDKNGEVEIALDMPENLTTWKIKAWSMAQGTRVGQGEVEVITSKDFLIRMQLPRFLVETDEAVVSAIVHNYLPGTKKADVTLTLAGDSLKAIDGGARTVEIKSGGEARIDWKVRALKEGSAIITMSAVTTGDSDAMKMEFPVIVHGIDKMVAYSGSLPRDKSPASAFITINVPEERRIESAKLQINYSPTLAAAMLDAVPYLVSNDYQNTEATLNRFLPAAIVYKTLKQLNIKLPQIEDKRTNLNPQEIGDPSKRAAQWKRWKDNPVFNDQKLEAIVKEGIKALRFMQNSDGGWGWFSGYNEQSWPHTTAQIVRGLLVAQEYNIPIDSNSLQRGIDWLKAYQTDRLDYILNHKSTVSNIDALVFRVLALSDFKSDSMDKMGDYLYNDRKYLSLYGKALYGLGLSKRGETQRLDMIMENIGQFLETDKENQTAWLRMPQNNWWWCWFGAEYETQAAYLELLTLREPKGQTAAWMVKYLLNNRKHASYWNSSRDTALCLEAMAGYLRRSGEMEPDMTVKVLIDGQERKSVKITKDNLFSFDSSLILYGNDITSGRHSIELRREGQGPLYFNVYLSYFSLEKFICKTGLEIKVERKYYMLERVKDASIKTSGSHGQALDMKVEKYKRVPIANLSTLKSGDLVEVELVIDSKNDYEYLLFEDRKAAGFEPCEVRSGYNGNELGAYVEFRDMKVRFFVRCLARGKHSVSYRLRAEIPGQFSALPASGLGIYAPELKANSDEFNIVIKD